MAARNPVFFLIDDDEDDREIFGLVLNKISPSVEYHTAQNGYEAIEKFKTQPDFKPDFIILDLNMPKMNGRQCLAELKNNARIKDVPVFIYSTSADPQDEENLISSGASSFFVKPSELNDLIVIINKILDPAFSS